MDSRSPGARIVRRLVGALLVLSFLFASDFIRLHTHADGAPVSAECVACSSGVTAAAESVAVRAPTSPAVSVLAISSNALPWPPTTSVRHAYGLRDPPFPIA